MKIIVLTAIWQRHELFEIFKLGFERIKEASEHEFELVTIGSENIKFSDNHIESPNQPLSNKWQSGIDHIKEMDFDYVLMLGSDDVICSKLLDVYTPAMNDEYDLIGLLDCYFLDARTDRFTFWRGYTNHRRGESIGMARMLSKKLLQKMNWNVWNAGLKKGLDSSMMRNLKKIQYSEKMFRSKDENIAGIDIKTNINVSNIRDYTNLHEEPFQNFGNFVSEEEFYSTLKLK